MPKKADILYLSYDGMTDPLGQSQVLSYLTRLSDEFSITLISYEKPGRYERDKAVVLKMIEGFDIDWHPLPYHKKPPVISTLIDLRNGWRRIQRLYKQKTFGIVHCRGYITAILGRKCKKYYGAKFIFDMRGWWPDEKKESGLWNGLLYKPVYQYLKRLERDFFRESDITISLTHRGKEEITGTFGQDESKVAVIPTCVSFDVFKDYNLNTRHDTRKSLNIPEGANVLIYSGSVGGNYRTDVILDIFKAGAEQYPDLYLILLTHTDEAEVNNEVRKSRADSSHIRVVSSSYQDVHQYLMAADVGLIMYERKFSVMGRSPTKLGEYWASGLPFISARNIGDLNMLEARYPLGGKLVSSLSGEVYIEAIETAFKYSKDKIRLRQYAIDYFDVDKGVESYRSLYHKLLD